MNNSIRFLILCLFLCFFTGKVHAQIYKNPQAPINDRVKNLLGTMTLDEKIGQMTQGDYSAISKDKNQITTYFLGSVLSGGSADPADISAKGWADMYDNLQSYALKTRLEIPLIYGIDAVHGHNNVSGAVIFPHNIGLGCTRNPTLVENAGRITAIEIAGTGIDWTFAPCIAVPRDERWGRTYEGFGETAELAEMFAPAMVNGLQGKKLNDSTSVVACAKHFVGEGATSNGQNQGNAQIDTATLRAIHLPGYIAAIKQNVGTVMASYNSWNGVKCHGSKYLLTDLLKDELGFKGFVVSDWDAIDQLPGDYASDIETSINAGIDMVMVPSKYVEFYTTLKSLVLAGKIPQSRIDDAVSRILTIKFQLGLFEKPYTNRSLTSLVGSQAHREVARECVRQSLVVLMKKDGVLPLSKTGIKIHVSGKNADNLQNQCGGWTLGWQDFEGKTTTGTTILQAIKKKTLASNVRYSLDGSNAAGADVAIAVVGETPYAEGVGDKSDLSLDMADVEVVRKLKASGLPVIVILVSGRPLIINSILPYCNALIAAWLPGTEGDGVADVLFGDFQPVGLLGHSWPRYMQQIPINVGDESYDPLFPYNFGMTSLADAPVGTAPHFYSANTLSGGDTVEITFNKKMSDPNLHVSNFSVKVNGTKNQVKMAVLKSSDHNTIQLVLTNPVKADDQITFSYLPGAYSSHDNGLLGTIANEPVYNLLNEFKLIAKIPGKVEAESFIAMSGIQTENTSDAGGGKNVGYIDSNDWMDYKLNVTKAGNYKVQFRVASESSGGQLLIKQGAGTLANVSIPVTNGWQSWKTITDTISLKEGIQTLRVFVSKGGWNMNWFSFDYATGISSVDREPNHFFDFRNYPNPFNSVTNISFAIHEVEAVKLEILNANGNKIVTLIDELAVAGEHRFEFDGQNLPGGLYLLKLQVGNRTEIRKMVLMKRP
jgi:beta-glucosidase